MHAIITKYIGHNNRIKATCDDGSITIGYDYSLNNAQAHLKAAQALADKLGWTAQNYGKLIGDRLPKNGGCVFLFNTDFGY